MMMKVIATSCAAVGKWGLSQDWLQSYPTSKEEEADRFLSYTWWETFTSLILIKLINTSTVVWRWWVFVPVCQRRPKGSKVTTAAGSLPCSGSRYSDGAEAAGGGLTWRDPVTGAQYVQIQLLQVRSLCMMFSAFSLRVKTSSKAFHVTFIRLFFSLIYFISFLVWFI